MANTTITIDHTLEKGADWYNITHNGNKVGIRKANNPKTISAIDSGAISVDVNLVSKDGKYYAWDVNEQKQAYNGNKGGSRFSPEFEERKQKMIIAQSSMSTAASFYHEKQVGEEQVMAFAEKIYNWVIEKSK